MPVSLIRLAVCFMLLALGVRAQSTTLDTFDGTIAPAGVLPGTSWAGATAITRGATTITINSPARDDSGWGRSGLAINGSDMTHVRVVAQRNAGNAAPIFLVTLRDSLFRPHTVSVLTSAFAVGELTTVDIPLGAWQGGFNPADINDWDMGGGSAPPGNNAFRMTFDQLSLVGGSPPAAPTITDQPRDRAIGVGTGTIMEVTATSPDAIRYQWKKAGIPIPGATTATLSFSNVSLETAGLYQVDVTNDTGTTPSDDARLTVLNAVPTQALAPGQFGYVAGGTVTIANHLVFGGGVTELVWQTLLPLGWEYVSATGVAGATMHVSSSADDGATLLEWRWAVSSLPATSPLNFTYTLSVPGGSEREEEVVSLITYGQDQITGDIIARPDPLIIRNFLARHSADLNGDLAIGLNELTRVIELYSTRHGTVTTGVYAVATRNTEDGFDAAPARVGGEAATLARYHSADADRNGAIDLTELLFMIELYNYRLGTVRTGQYHLDSSTHEGFKRGPAP